VQTRSGREEGASAAPIVAAVKKQEAGNSTGRQAQLELNN